MTWEDLGVRTEQPFPELDDYACEEAFLKLVAYHCRHFRPKRILECGSGVSTVLLGHLCNELFETWAVALEHSESYAARTRSMLRAHQLGSVAVWRQPLVEQSFDFAGRPRAFMWYDIEDTPIRTIDMLIVDGPPSSVGPFARYPAVPALADALTPGCVILTDDANRPQEQETIEMWAEDYGFEITHLETERGAALLRRPDAKRHRVQENEARSEDETEAEEKEEVAAA